jgi:hypothetical protein
VMDRRPELSTVVVAGSHVSGGLVDLPHDIRLEAGDRSFQSTGGVA